MNIRHVILSMLIIFLFTSGITLAQSVENSTSSANSTLTNSTVASSSQSSAVQAASTENASAGSSVQNLKYIWSVTGVEKDPIIIALDQDGSDIFGQAKYEPDSGESWNGIIDGSISGDQVKLTITAQKGKSLESIKLNGAFADDALSGKFTRISEGKVMDRGDFNAVWISPDISSYTPAKVTDAAASQPQAVTTVTAPVQTSNTTSTSNQATAGQTTQTPVKLGGNTKYVDVHEYAEKIGPGGDLSGVPPGMGGSGLE